MKTRMHLVVFVMAVMSCFAGLARAVTINFDDVAGSNVDITNQYAGLGVTLNAIANSFPLAGAYPAPLTVPTVLGGVTTWIEGFPSATSGSQVAVSAPTAQTGQAGNGGILISFAFDVTSVSLIGNDVGGLFTGDAESVTLTAYDATGSWLGQTFSTTKIAGFDRTPASISMSGIRYVAFNYTDTQFGFYAIDDLEFSMDTNTRVPDTSATLVLLALGLGSLAAARRTLRSSRPSR